MAELREPVEMESPDNDAEDSQKDDSEKSSGTGEASSETFSKTEGHDEDSEIEAADDTGTDVTDIRNDDSKIKDDMPKEEDDGHGGDDRNKEHEVEFQENKTLVYQPSVRIGEVKFEKFHLFKGLFWEVVDFFEPPYKNIKESGPHMAVMCNYLETVWKNLSDFVRERDNFWEITFSDAMDFFTRGKETVVQYTNTRYRIRFILKIWNTTQQFFRSWMKDLENVFEYVVAPIRGEEPFYEIDYENEEEFTLRWLCFCITMNAGHRMYLRIKGFICHTMNYFDQRNESTLKEMAEMKVQRIPEEPQNEEEQQTLSAAAV